MQKPDLVVCGSIAIDRIMNFSGQYKDMIKPDKVHVLSLSVLLQNLIDTYGGVGANICYTLALLNEKPILMGAVGPDGDKYLNRLQSLGIDTRHIHISDKPTASFNVITDTDDNQVGGFYPGAMSDSTSLSFKSWQNKNVFITIAPHDPVAMRRQVAECKKYGLRLFYDISQQVSNTPAGDIALGVKVAELLIVNDYEFAVICEKLNKTPDQIKQIVPVVVITKGKAGSTIEGSKVPKKITIKSAKPSSVIDPTGAGDAFRAGFLYGYIRGWDLQKCGQIGATTAVYAIEQHGTQAHYFTLDEFNTRLLSNFDIKL